MLRNHFNQFSPLREKHEESPPSNSGGSPAPEPAPAPEKKDGEDEPEPEPKPEPEPTPEPATPPAPEAPGAKLNAFQRGALRALGTGDLIARVERAELAEAAANAEVSRLTAENTRLSTDLATLRATTNVKIVEAQKGRANEVSQGVRKELTGLGITEESAPSQINADQTPEALLEKFHTLKGAEKTSFWRTNKAALKAAEAAQTK